jgi:tetratricopeptide (TPR) repeat protein
MKRRNRPKSSAASPTPEPDRIAAGRLWKPTDWLFLVVLLATVVFIYQPAWQGGLIWDDDAHITRPELRSLHGLYRIWFDVKATQQYYPLLHSAFWIEHELWGDVTLGYHLVNILLHVTAAMLVALILRRLKIPGAYLAAALFAVHPVQVESVAWITEQKNTLSAVFYLAAAMVYLGFDEKRKMPLYFGALGLFVLGLLSKTVTATLPAALLVIFWWQRGRLSWRRDVLPLMPFFVLGAVAGVFTAWVERKLLGAEGTPFDLTLVDRCLIAGRVIWFYLGKLLWPGELLFIYPRWQISQAIWWQYLFPLAALTLLAVLWGLRRRWRGPLAGMLYFAGTLFPVLGFCNVYPFIYSFVADHFQYLACLGIITVVSAGVARWLARWRLWNRPAGYVVCLAPLAVLAGLTWQQSRMYADIETLYQTTIDRNPECWMAYTNLGLIRAAQGRTDEAIGCYLKTLEIKPDDVNARIDLANALYGQRHVDEAIAQLRKALETNPDDLLARSNLATYLCDQGRVDEAMTHCWKVLEIDPQWADAHNVLGNALRLQGKLDEAVAEYRKALKIAPDRAATHNNFGLALRDQGHIAEAIDQFRRALELNPRLAVAYNSLGLTLHSQGQVAEALEQFRKAVEVNPGFARAHFNLARILIRLGQTDEAMAECRRTLELDPKMPEAYGALARMLADRGQPDEAIGLLGKALQIESDRPDDRYTLGFLLYQQGKLPAAMAQWSELLRLHPDNAAALNQLAWVLATAPAASDRNGAKAVEMAQHAVKLAGGKEPNFLDTLAAAQAEAARFAEAVETAREALKLATQQNNEPLAESIKAKIPLYEAGTPFREMPPPAAAPSTRP